MPKDMQEFLPAEDIGKIHQTSLRFMDHVGIDFPAPPDRTDRGDVARAPLFEHAGAELSEEPEHGEILRS